VKICRFVVLALVLATAALAASVHFTTGPTFSSSGGALKACGTIAGLGNQDVTVRLTATANTQCVNKGGNPPPGQRTTVSGTVSNLEPKNGSLSFCVTTNRPPNPCPDGMRPVTTFSNAQLTIYQGGKVVYQQSYNP
jgi:hypothetical protein